MSLCSDLVIDFNFDFDLLSLSLLLNMSHWKFIHEKELPKERAFGRDHYWHFKPDISPDAETCFVKVVMQNGDGHDFHRHPEMNEILYILKGKAEQWVEDEKRILEVGDSVYIAPNVIHATFNAGEDELEFLAVLSPANGWEAGTIDESKRLPYSTYRSQ